MRFKGTKLPRVACAAGAILAATVASIIPGLGQQSKALDKVTYASPFPVVGSVIPAFGKELGIFEKHRIDLDAKYIRPGPLEAAILSGSVDFSMVPAPVNIDMTLTGAGVTTVMTYMKKFVVKLMGKDVATLGELRGKVISTTTGMSSYLIDQSLKQAGMSPGKDVHLRPIANQSDTMNALLTGQVSAGVLGPPFWAIAEAQGATVLVDYVKMADRPWATANIVALKSYLEKNSDVATRFVSAMLETLEAWNANPEKAKEILARETKMENPKLVQRMYDHSLEVLASGANAAPSADVFQVALEMMTEARKTDPTTRSVEGRKPSDFYDASFVDRALGK